jgi:serine/threonine-protein kinase
MNDEAAALDLSTSDRGSTAPPRPGGAPRASSPPRGPYALVALLSLLVVALAIGIVIVVRSPTEPLPAAASAASPVGPPPVQVAPAEAVPAAVRPVEAPAAVEDADEPALSIGKVETRPTPSAARAPSGRSTPRKTTAPEPPEPPAAEPRPPARESCNPPYHFEGTKKIFKPACL